MNRFDPTKTHAVVRGVAARDRACVPQGVPDESIRVIGG